MMKLKPIPTSELNSYVIELLANRRITNVREFQSTDTDELSKITNLSRNAVEELRAKVHKTYCPKRLNLLSRYNKLKTRRIIYGFDIKSCDDMLDDRKFRSGSVFEIYGEAGIGKSQLCLTIALNLVRNTKAEALYIDTKNDFSATRLFDMLRARNIDNVICGHIMQCFKVEQTMTLKGVLKILKQLYDLLEAKSSEVTGIKLVIIDALPAVWFVHNTDEERFERKAILSQIANLIHKIAHQHLLAFLLVNLAVQNEELFADNAAQPNLPDEELEIDSSPSSIKRRRSTIDECPNGLSVKPTLGRYWIAVPHVRILLKTPDDAEENSTERLVEVTRNCFGPIGINCRVWITDAGVES